MSKLSDQLKNKSFDLHRDKDGSWGTDSHDADILKGLAAVVSAIGTIIGVIIAKKK